MLAYIYHKTIWKYNTTNADYNKIMINNILNKNQSSGLFRLYQKNIIEISNEKTYINKLYNLYQSIKLLINLTDYEDKDTYIYNPIFLNVYYKRYKNLESQNKIKVKRLIKNNRNDYINDEIQLDNSLSSIQKTIDLDERDNYEKGCVDFAIGNEMDLLLKNIQQNPNECLYNNYFRNCNIYKKKKSPQVSFRIFSPKNRNFFGENELFENPIKNNLINNNIYINNNNYNNHTNYYINDYNLNNKNNYNENNLIIKKYHHFGNYKSQTQTNILSSRISCRNRLSIPQSQSCEKFVYKKKYISSKLKDKKLGNKTSEDFEEEKDENEITTHEKNLNNIKLKPIPYMHKNINVKILENLVGNYDDNIDNNQKTNKTNYMGRNNFNFNNNLLSKYPFLLSRITKNSKTNRKSNLTQDQNLTKFHSTFNLHLNYLSNIKEKPIKPNKSKIEKNISNHNINTNDKKINKKDNKNENKALLKLIDKKEKKVIKRKENQFKFKKNNTAKNNINSYKKNEALREKVLEFGKKNKKEKKIEKENKEIKKKVKEIKKEKTVNSLNAKRFNSPPLNRDNITQIISQDQLTCKYRTKKISYKELYNNKMLNDFSNVNKSNANINLDLNKFYTTKVKHRKITSNKSNNNINSISKQLFSPKKYDYLTTNKISFVSNEKIIDSYYDINNLIYGDENLNNSYFKTLPTKNEENEKEMVLSKSANNKLIINKIVSKKNKIKEIPIKVNLNKNSINKISQSKSPNTTNNKKNFTTEKSIESNKQKNTCKYTSTKRIINLEKISKKNNKNIKIEIYNAH